MLLITRDLLAVRESRSSTHIKTVAKEKEIAEAIEIEVTEEIEAIETEIVEAIETGAIGEIEVTGKEGSLGQEIPASIVTALVIGKQHTSFFERKTTWDVEEGREKEITKFK
jgi:hypothetical protein